MFVGMDRIIVRWLNHTGSGERESCGLHGDKKKACKMLLGNEHIQEEKVYSFNQKKYVEIKEILRNRFLK